MTDAASPPAFSTSKLLQHVLLSRPAGDALDDAGLGAMSLADPQGPSCRRLVILLSPSSSLSVSFSLFSNPQFFPTSSLSS